MLQIEQITEKQSVKTDFSYTALPGVMRYISSGQDARTTRGF